MEPGARPPAVQGNGSESEPGAGARLRRPAGRLNIRGMSKSQVLQKAGTKAIEVAVEASRGIVVRARGTPANIIAYGAAAALVLVGGAVAAGIYYSVKGLKDSKAEPQQADLPV